MKKNTIIEIQNQLIQHKTQLPTHIAESLGEVLGAAHALAKYYLPDTYVFEDKEDVISEAIYRCLRYINSTLEENIKSVFWSKEEWNKRLYSRLHDGILEGSGCTIFPFRVPRPLRFSLKKYSDALDILRRYEQRSSYQAIYTAIFLEQCNLTTIVECKKCKLDYPRCPLLIVDPADLLSLHYLLTGPKSSLSHYARNYRKDYTDWIQLLKTVDSYSVLHESEDEIMDMSVNPNMEAALTLKELAAAMNKVHPELFNIYCQSFSDVDIDNANETLMLRRPEGWVSKDLKERFGLDASGLSKLLASGDHILNKFRKREGLPPLQRSVQRQSAS